MNTQPPRLSLGDTGEEPNAPSEEEVLSSRSSERKVERSARLRQHFERTTVGPSASQINMLINSLNNVASVMLMSSKAVSPSMISTSDLRPLEQFTALPSLFSPQAPLDDLDRLKRHKPKLIASTKCVYPKDSARFWNQVYAAVENGHRGLVDGQAAKTMPHLYADQVGSQVAGYLSDAVSSVAGEDQATKDIRRAAARIKFFEPVYTWKSHERDTTLDGYLSGPTKKSMTAKQKAVAKAAFGEDPTVVQLLYTVHADFYSGTADQKDAAEEEFRNFKSKNSESVYEAIERYKAYSDLVVEWGITLPGARKGIQTLDALIKDRKEHFPNDVKWSLDQYTGKKGLSQVGGANWQPVWEYAAMLQSLLLENPHSSDYEVQDPLGFTFSTGSEKNNKGCKGYVRGRCNRGEDCTYRHETSSAETTGTEGAAGEWSAEEWAAWEIADSRSDTREALDRADKCDDRADKRESDERADKRDAGEEHAQNCGPEWTAEGWAAWQTSHGHWSAEEWAVWEFIPRGCEPGGTAAVDAPEYEGAGSA